MIDKDKRRELARLDKRIKQGDTAAMAEWASFWLFHDPKRKLRPQIQKKAVWYLCIGAMK